MARSVQAENACAPTFKPTCHWIRKPICIANQKQPVLPTLPLYVRQRYRPVGLRSPADSRIPIGM